jgi:MoaA/NifB/PqqE/SkfB family radical SAM enzyme
LLSVYYLTYACELRCPYCADGFGTPYHQLKNPVLRGGNLNTLLGKIRANSDHLVITGGEPLRHPDFAELLAYLPAHRFDSAILTTSGHGLLPHLDGVARAFSHVVFSLDTLDEAKGNRYYGRGPGVHAEIRATILAAAARFKRRPRILLSCVATPDNLPDVPAVYDFARSRGFRFSLSPVLRGVAPDPALPGNPAYRALFDRLIADQRRGVAIQGSPAYLRAMRDFTAFRCRPSTVLAIAPTGEVFYPCLEQGRLAGSLLDAPDLHHLRLQAKATFGAEPVCPNQCQSPCALGFSLLLEKPATVIGEGVTWLRSLPWRVFSPRALPGSSGGNPPCS